jgi:hypothetical protein
VTDEIKLSPEAVAEAIVTFDRIVATRGSESDERTKMIATIAAVAVALRRDGWLVRQSRTSTAERMRERCAEVAYRESHGPYGSAAADAIRVLPLEEE